MKRYVKLLAAAMALLLLVGCGGQGTPQPSETETATTQPPTQPPAVTEPATEPTEDDTPKVKIRFFTVNGVEAWGDCTYIEFPNGENMLIDTGLPAAAAQIVDELLDAGIDEIDYLVLTHSHSDHCKGVSNFLANITFHHAFSSGYWATDYQWVLRDLRGRNVDHTVINAGDTFDIGDVHFEVLWPTKEAASVPMTGATTAASGQGSIEDLNNMSLVFRMTYGDNKVLFTGDIFKRAEGEILQYYADDLSVLDSDVLKIMHHSYATSGSEEFLKAVSPQWAVSMGTMTMSNMQYRTYADLGCTCYFSWMNGNVNVTLDGTSITVTPDDPTILDYYLTGSGSLPSDSEGGE